MTGSLIAITILFTVCVLFAFFAGRLITEIDTESRALGGALIVVCIILGAIMIAITDSVTEGYKNYTTTTQAGHIDYDKVDIQVVKKNGKVTEVIYSYNNETIHMPIKEDNSDD